MQTKGKRNRKGLIRFDILGCSRRISVLFGIFTVTFTVFSLHGSSNFQHKPKRES